MFSTLTTYTRKYYFIQYRTKLTGAKMDTEKLYTATEAAGLLQVHPNTVKSWHRKRKIKSVQVGNGWIRIPESEIKRILGEVDT